MDFFEDSGLLPRLHSDELAPAMQTLPPAALATVDVMEIEHDVPRFGHLRITVKRRRARHRKSSHYFWSATKAVLIEK